MQKMETKKNNISKKDGFVRMTSKEFLLMYSQELKYSNANKYQFGDRLNKYKNKIVEWSGIWNGKRVTLKFHSKKEMDRGIWLIHREKSRSIKYLSFQKTFLLVPKFKEERHVTYTADAYYFDMELNCWVAEDTKSPSTRKLPSYIIKRKLLKYNNPDLNFIEV